MSEASSSGLLDSLRRLGATALETVQVRADLLAVELEQEKRRLLGALLLGALALLLLGVGLVLLVGLLLMLLQETYRVAALSVLTLAFLGAGLALVLRARRQLESPGGLAAGSRGELARDRQALAGAAGAGGLGRGVPPPAAAAPADGVAGRPGGRP